MTDLPKEDRDLIERVLGKDEARWLARIGCNTFSVEMVAKLLAAARDEGRAEGLGGWEPIEAAKRDGRHYLACNNPPTMPYRPTWGFNQRPPVVVHWFDDPEEPGWYPSYGAGDQPPMQLTHVLELPAPPASQAASQREAGWLVEHYASKRGEYLAEWLTGWPAFDDSAPETWTKDSAQALRFARREDAEQVIQALGWTEARATEHVWGAPPASQTQEG